MRRRRRVAGWSRPRRGDEILESRRVDERERQVLAVNKLSDLGVQLLAVGGVEGVGDWKSWGESAQSSARINERTMMRIVDMVNYGSLRALYKPIRIVELD